MVNETEDSTQDLDERMALVCALPDDVLATRRVAIEAVLRARTAARLCADGVEMEFVLSAAITRILLEFVLYEQACCKSFTYLLCFLPPHEAVTLRVLAPAEQVTLLHAFYAELLDKKP